MQWRYWCRILEFRIALVLIWHFAFWSWFFCVFFQTPLNLVDAGRITLALVSKDRYHLYKIVTMQIVVHLNVVLSLLVLKGLVILLSKQAGLVWHRLMLVLSTKYMDRRQRVYQPGLEALIWTKFTKLSGVNYDVCIINVWYSDKLLKTISSECFFCLF